MDLLGVMVEAGRWLLRVLAVVLPLLAWQWIFALARPYRGDTGPLGLTLAAGVMIGLAALAELFPFSPLSWDAIVAPGGLWDLSVPEFLSLSVRIVRRAVPALLAALRHGDEQRNVRTWLGAAAALWFIRLAIGLLAWPKRGGGQFLLAEIACFVAALFGTIYAGPLLLWSANRLNFWLFLVVVLLIQDYRYDRPPILQRLLRIVGRHRSVTAAD
jgi:hypothetical protein